MTIETAKELKEKIQNKLDELTDLCTATENHGIEVSIEFYNHREEKQVSMKPRHMYSARIECFKIIL